MNVTKKTQSQNISSCCEVSDPPKDFSEILFNQNQTIFELTNELNNKESIIKQLSNNQASISEATQAQLSTYQKEIKLLQTKLSMASSDYDNQISSQDDIIKSSQSKIKQLNDTLSLKDRKLNELVSIVSEYDKQSESQKNQIIQLEKVNKELRGLVDDMSSNYQKVSVKLNNKKEEAKSSFNSVYGIQLEKEVLEDKAKELVNILKEYSIEVARLENTNTLLINQNDNLKRDNEELVRLNFEIEEKQKSTNKDFYFLKEDNESMHMKIGHYEKIINTMSTENKKLLLNNEQFNGLIKLKEVEITKTENTTQDFSLKINNDLLSIANWINSYLLLPTESYNKRDQKKNIPKIKIESCHSAFDILIKTLEGLKDKNDEERDRLTNKIVNLTQATDGQYKDIDKIENELRKSKDDLNILRNDNEKLKNDNCRFSQNNLRNQEIINELNKKISLSNQQNSIISDKTPEKILQMIKYVNDSQILSKKYQSSSIDTNQNLNEIINTLIEQFREVLALISQRKEGICNECIKLKNEQKSIEKKHNALLTELELKQIQIQKQEEIINRRHQLSSNDKDLIKRLQIEKEKLLQDNITLIQQSSRFKSQ